MATTTLKTRIQHKYNTPAKWAEDTSFVPLKGEICVFNNGTGAKPEMKIGDGTTTLASLPFLKAGGDIAVSRSLTSGTKIATITIDGVATNLYCQTNTDTTYSAGTGLSLNGTTFSVNSNVLTTSNYNSYAPTLTGSGASGTWGINITGNASSLNSQEPTLSTGHEYSAISIKGNPNGALGIDEHLSLKTAIDFQWYGSNWQIGNMRSGGTPSAGFGFACKQEGEESFSLKARITPDSELILYNSANFYATLAPNNITGYGNLRLTGTEKGGYYGIHLGDNVNYMTLISSAAHQGLYNEANYKWIIYYNKENDRIGLGTHDVEGYTVTVGGSLKADNLYGTLHGNAATATKWATARTISLSGDLSGSVSIDGSANVTLNASVYDNSHTHTWLELAPGNVSLPTGVSMSNDTGPFNIRWISTAGLVAGQPNQYGFLMTMAAAKGSAEQHQLWFTQCDGDIYHRGTNGQNSDSPPSFKRLWHEGHSITSAVWNDYAEYRESDCAEFGRVLAENGDDTLSTTTERLQHFAGISSDTWGFCQGETEKAKTPIAVAGRVLAYTYQERSNYKPGDCVCAAPNGTVDIMTREEVEHYPDRIVGTVSCVPEYEEWGQGDRPAVRVDGRIWVKVR